MNLTSKTYMDIPKGEILNNARHEISKIYKEQVGNQLHELISSKSEVSGIVVDEKTNKHFVCKITAELFRLGIDTKTLTTVVSEQ